MTGTEQIDLGQLAAEARAASARCYRRARKCERDTRRYALAADGATAEADRLIARIHDPLAISDHLDWVDQTRALVADQRALAKAFRQLAATNEQYAPIWRTHGADMMAQARAFERQAAGDPLDRGDLGRTD